MSNYPEVVAKIAGDYLERVKSQLQLVPKREQDEFLLEIQSHLYEAYQRMPGDDEVARILAVLRNLGEPAEVVADRLPSAMVPSRAKRNLPLHVAGGILIALFGIPLGFGGVAVISAVLFSMAAFVAAYFVAAGAVFLSSALLTLLGLARIYKPQMWDKLVEVGVIQIDNRMADFLDQIPITGQGLMLIMLACVLAVTSFAMFWIGRYLLRGLRFLFTLASTGFVSSGKVSAHQRGAKTASAHGYNLRLSADDRYERQRRPRFSFCLPYSMDRSICSRC